MLNEQNICLNFIVSILYPGMSDELEKDLSFIPEPLLNSTIGKTPLSFTVVFLTILFLKFFVFKAYNSTVSFSF